MKRESDGERKKERAVSLYGQFSFVEQTDRIIKLLRLEKTPNIISSSHQAIPIMPTDHVSQCHIYVILEHLLGRCLHHLPGQPVLLPHHSF